MNRCWDAVFNRSNENWEERYRWEFNQDHLVFSRGKEKNLVSDYRQLLKVCEQLNKNSAFLVTIIATDERQLEDGCFKLYYVFSHDIEDQFLILEYPLQQIDSSKYFHTDHSLSIYLEDARIYPSIRVVFAASAPFEREIFDLFDLVAFVVDGTETISPVDPLSDIVPSNILLHNPYPPRLAPLEASNKLEDIKKKIDAYAPPINDTNKVKVDDVLMSVGPIHAGIIEAGRFSFHIASETVDDVDLQLGFKHKGIEKLFQTKFSLLDGWQLAEKVSGDSSFSHSLAYCHAIEALANIEVPTRAVWLRGLFLELERLYNHIGDCAALARDVAFDIVASEIAVMREHLVRLNAELTGHRLLRGVNRPGGIALPDRTIVFNEEYIHKRLQKASRNKYTTLKELFEQFHELGALLLRTPAFRDRALNTGILDKDQANALGATGLVARASGIQQRDFRINHPFGIYMVEPKLRELVDLRSHIQDNQEIKKLRMSGDVFSRLEMRLHEVDTSMQVIQEILKTLHITPEDDLMAPYVEETIRRAENFEFAIGYVEGWRGDIIYWIMKDRFNKIFRCKVRDPSFLNWPALREAVKPDDPERRDETGNILPDFPVINKSFNLSYSGHDL
jgi:Ni,Fe-hydrogenase III large subunit/Ni,Fe-hydrogenase III component G